jgi:hypothetical protein
MKNGMLELVTWLLIMPAAVAQTFHGPGIAGDTLNNHQVSTTDVDYRFRAATTGAVNSLLWYDISTIHSCPPAGGQTYGCGNGGIMHICIQTDDGTANHLASGTNLACADDASPLNPAALRTISFPSPPTLTAGTLYHIHWHNTASDPVNNFTSVDANYAWDATTPRQQTISDTDLAVFRGTTLQPHDTPIFQLTYANGTQQGQGYMEYWVTSAPLISGSTWVREQFTASGGDKVVSSISLRMKRDQSNNSGTSPLTVRLETGAGTLIEQGTIPATAFPVGTRTDDVNNHNAWGTYTFSTPRTLTSGQSYHVVLSSPSDTTYVAQPIRKGSSYGFVAPAIFTDGYGQYSTNGGSSWSGFDQAGGSTNRTDADVQFYFTIGSSASIVNPPVGLTATVQ